MDKETPPDCRYWRIFNFKSSKCVCGYATTGIVVFNETSEDQEEAFQTIEDLISFAVDISPVFFKYPVLRVSPITVKVSAKVLAELKEWP